MAEGSRWRVLTRRNFLYLTGLGIAGVAAPSTATAQLVQQNNARSSPSDCRSNPVPPEGAAPPGHRLADAHAL